MYLINKMVNIRWKQLSFISLPLIKLCFLFYFILELLLLNRYHWWPLCMPVSFQSAALGPPHCVYSWACIASGHLFSIIKDGNNPREKNSCKCMLYELLNIVKLNKTYSTEIIIHELMCKAYSIKKMLITFSAFCQLIL